MAIDWRRVEFISLTDDTSCWKYPSDDVAGDLLALDAQLPKFPPHQLIAARRSIWAVFDGSDMLGRLGATIDRISDRIVHEGMGVPPVAKKGEPR